MITISVHTAFGQKNAVVVIFELVQKSNYLYLAFAIAIFRLLYMSLLNCYLFIYSLFATNTSHCSFFQLPCRYPSTITMQCSGLCMDSFCSALPCRIVYALYVMNIYVYCICLWQGFKKKAKMSQKSQQKKTEKQIYRYTNKLVGY